HCKVARVLRTEMVDDPYQDDDANGPQTDVIIGEAEILYGGPRADGGCDGEIRHQQQRAHDCEQTALVPGGRIDTATVREMAADDDVIVADDGRQHADCEDDRQRGETGCDERQPYDVCLARAPIPVEQCASAFPIYVAGTMNRCAFHC